VHDRIASRTSMESVCGSGVQASMECWRTQISDDGRFVVFDSPSDNLVNGDTNGQWDVFVHHRQSGTTERASVDSAGQQANGWSASARITADGRYVAFDSMASNLVPGDTNGFLDVFVRSRWNGLTQRVNLGPGGVQSNGLMSFLWDLTPDGRYVAFSSTATNLVPGDTNGQQDVFVRDLWNGTTERVSLGSGGAQANGASDYASLSADGRYVAFQSAASNLVAGDSNGASDVFVRDRQTGDTRRVSVHSSGGQGNGASSLPRISADGRWVAFQSLASSLVNGDFNSVADVFVHDRQMSLTERISVDSLGMQSDGASERARISADGQRVAFRSLATNLVPGDTNAHGDVFVHDRSSGATVRVSVSSAGTQSTGESYWPAISAEGRHVAFTSHGPTLVPGDTNGVEDAFVHDLDPLAPTAFCYGDGSETPCPCGNSGAPGRGCENPHGSDGVLLTASGTPSANDVVLHGTEYPPAGTPGVVVMRSPNLELTPLAFGDGLRCIGAVGLVRLGATIASGGASTHPLNHAAGPGTFHYQLWYRSTPASYCDPAAAFNLSNGLSITWP
jgi:Tol biopolymer transport system component